MKWWQQLLLAFQVIALHVTLALGIVAWEGLPVLVHTPADTPLPAFGGSALLLLIEAFLVTVGELQPPWAEHVLELEVVEHVLYFPAAGAVFCFLLGL